MEKICAMNRLGRDRRRRKQNDCDPPSDHSTIIADLRRAIEDLVSRRKKSQELEGMIDEAKALACDWKDPYSAQKPRDRRPLFDVTATDTNFLLAALVVALTRDHELVVARAINVSPRTIDNATAIAITEKTRFARAVLSFHQTTTFISASVRHAPLPMDQMTVTQFIAPSGSKADG
jgi:hypothetical protein